VFVIDSSNLSASRTAAEITSDILAFRNAFNSCLSLTLVLLELIPIPGVLRLSPHTETALSVHHFRALLVVESSVSLNPLDLAN
jgi:hypothetical protein